jgi:hypothetical protein
MLQYGLRVRDGSLASWVKPGSIVWVDEARAVESDDLVMLVQNDEGDRRRCYVRTLRAVTDTDFVVVNPQDEVEEIFSRLLIRR